MDRTCGTFQRPAGALALVVAVALAAGAAPAPAAQAQDDPWAARLGRATTPAAVMELVPGGEPAALAALAELAAEGTRIDAAGRRARMALIGAAGGAACIGPALALEFDPDPLVRVELARFLASDGLRDAREEERVVRLTEVAERDLDGAVRRAALVGLARIQAESAGEALDGLIDRLPEAERRLAARALASRPRSRARIVARVQEAFERAALETGAERPVPGDVLEELLANGYGPALAEVPGGGLGVRDRVPLVLGTRHPSADVRRASELALRQFLGRLRFLGQTERADAVLAALAGAGLDDAELLAQRARLALEVGSDPSVALEAARRLRERAPPTATEGARRRHATAAMLEGAALLALRRGDEAAGPLAEAEALLAALRDEGRNPVSEEAAVRQAGVIESLGVIELYRALARLEADRDAADPIVLEHARTAHERSIEAQIVLVAQGAAASEASLETLIDAELGPFRLVLRNARNPEISARRALDLELELCRALSTVAPEELPGFRRAAPVAPRLASPFRDPARLFLLQRVQSAEIQRVEEDLAELDDRFGLAALDPGGQQRIANLDRMRRMLRRVQREDGNGGHAGLSRLRLPSGVALDLAADLRNAGRFRAAEQLARRLTEDLDAYRPAEVTVLPTVRLELLKARADMAIGSARMDLEEPDEAEALYLDALRRLEAVEADLEDRGAVRLLREVLGWRSSCLVSLAVNANVKQRDVPAALDYFERAFEIRQDDFMRVLLACYRARAGRGDEAREVLRDVPVSPSNYYNLACTYALLGETELALDFLQRDLEEAQASPESADRQRAWASTDPDFDTVRDDPRFQDLVRPRLADPADGADDR